MNIALFQPLTLLDMVVYHKETGGVFRIKEVKCNYPYRIIPSDMRREAVAMFLVEIMNKAVKEQSHPEELYLFLEQSLIQLDTITRGIENFHLFFLINLSRHLGFGPQMSGEILGGRIIPIEDENILQQIICDADVFHFGTKEFQENDNRALQEYKLKYGDTDLLQFKRDTIKMLVNHHFYSGYCKERLNEQKENNIITLQMEILEAEKLQRQLMQ